MSVTNFASVAASINQRLGQIEAAQTTAQGAVTAAIIAACVAALAAFLSFVGVFLTARVLRRNGFIQARATQQLKHADFRQAWINGLRDDMSNFLRLSTERISTPSTEPQVIQSMAMILLRIDRNDPQYGALVDALDDVLDSTTGKVSGRKPYGAAAGDYLSLCQEILKREWETTKSAMHEEPPKWGKPAKPKPASSAAPIKMPRHLDPNLSINPSSPPAAADNQ